MADIDRMFRSELAVLDDQPTESDIWPRSSVIDADWDSLSSTIDAEFLGDGDGLFPIQNRRIGGHLATEPTVHLSELSLGSIPPDILTPLSASSSAAPPSDSPTDPSSEDMSSDDADFTYPSDSDFLPSPTNVDPSSLSAACIDLHAIRPSRRGSRSAIKVPVPIPNLTKKSRGRKVPTSNGEPIYAASRDKTKKGVRTYTCNVDGCGKCFVRGEHLKRHIRSIHTDEKPWVCTYENCTRSFSRRDNLNQHLRIHKLQDGDD